MKHLLTTLSLGALLLMGGPTTVQAEKVTVPLTEDGAWSFNSQPSAVYYNGKTYLTWISSSKALVVASYDHTTGETKEKVVSKMFIRDRHQTIQDMLRTGVSGLSVGVETDTKGNSAMMIRGKGTIGASTNPLLVLDGVIYSGEMTRCV